MTRLLQYGLAVLTAATLAFTANATPTGADGKILNYVVEYSGEDMVSRTDYIYLPTGLVGEKIVQRTNPNNEGALENSEREVYGYDDQQRMNSYESYVWDRASLTFVGSPKVGSKTSTTFDEEGRPLEVIYYKWGTSGWEENQKGVFTYPENGVGSESRYKKLNGTWKADPFEIYDYTYDDQQRVVKQLRSSYSFNFESYDYKKTLIEKTVYNYDEQGNQTLYELYADMGGTSESGDPEEALSLMYRYKYEYEYNEDGLYTRKTTYTWRDWLGEYSLESDLTYEYHYISGGAADLPYSNDFNAENSFEGLDVADGNKDGNTWQWDGQAASCTTTQGNPEPDILYLPALNLKRADETRIRFTARVADAEKPGRIQMILCNNDDQKTPLGTIGEIHEITGTEEVEIVGYIVPDRDNAYRIGITFDNDQIGTEVIIDNLTVEYYRPSATPIAPYNMSATPASDGSLQVLLEWYAPYQTLAGDWLNSVDKMEVYRNDQETPVYATAATGSTLATRWIDNTVPEKGTYTYQIYAYVGELKSDPITATVKVGYAAPQAIQNLKIVENEDHSVTLSWDADETSESEVRYLVERNNEFIVTDAAGITSVTDKPDCSNGQVAVFYAITPYNEIGNGPTYYSGLLFVGESHALPFEESFAGGACTYQWMNEKVKGYDAAWGVGSQAYNPDAMPQDEDGGLASFQSLILAEGDQIRFTSEKFDLSSATDPVLRYYVYLTDAPASADQLTVEASTDNGEYKALTEPLQVSGHQETGWQEQIVSLNEFKGQANVRISFFGECGLTSNIHIDNIRVTDGISGIEAPATDNVRIYASDGQIHISADQETEFAIYTAAGVTIFSDNTRQSSVDVPAGIYLVRGAGMTQKVIVR